jgi:3-hydroxyisobutyrate dehydrogenase
MNIGFIGLGALGSALARQYLPVRSLIVWDVNARAIEAFRQLGAATAKTAAEMARSSDVISLCLPRSSDVRRAVFGPDGLAEGLSPGTLVIDHTSGIPDESRDIASRLLERGVVMIDAAVSASPQVVPQGGATLMISGPDAAIQRALPVLQAITQNIVRCGTRVGDGQAMKMMNNAMNAGCRLGTLEAAAMAVKSGLSLQHIGGVLNKGAGRSLTSERMLPALAEGRASTNFALSLMLKDLNQAISLGMEYGSPMPLANIVRALLQMGVNMIGDEARLEDIVGLVGSMAGAALGPSRENSKANSEMPPSTEADSLALLIDGSVATLCYLITYECVSTGLKYGLAIDDLAAVLAKSSGWSASGRLVLSNLASGLPMPDISLGDIVLELQRATKQAIACGVPMSIMNEARCLYEAASNDLGPTASIGAIAKIYGIARKEASL